MIVKITQKEGAGPYGYFHELMMEADRVEVQFYRGMPISEEPNWLYTDLPIQPDGGPVFVVRCWKAWPKDSYEMGVVQSGRIFVVNDAGKTVDKYTI